MKKKILRKVFMNKTADALGEIGLKFFFLAKKLLSTVSSEDSDSEYMEENAARKKGFKDICMLKTVEILSGIGRSIFRLSDKINMYAVYLFSPDDYDEYNGNILSVVRFICRNDDMISLADAFSEFESVLFSEDS